MERIENDASYNSSIVAFEFVAAETVLQSRCLEMIGRYTYRHTDWWEGFMNYANEMGSGAMIYIPVFIKIGSMIQKLVGGLHRRHNDLISLLLFFSK
jgi:hypothetical protein